MTINEMCVNNVSSGNNCNGDNSNYNQVTAKTINRRNRIANCGKTFDEVLENAQADIELDIPTPEFDAIGAVLEDMLELKDLDVEARLSNIESRHYNKELEAILGVSTDYYRDKYFALLKILSFCTDIK